MPELALYDPNPLQRVLHDGADAHRFYVASCSRQHGKSTFLRVEAVHCAIQGGTAAIICPFRLQAKNIHLAGLIALAILVPGAQVNLMELKVTFPGGGSVQLFGSDNADALRGLSLDLALFDEAAYVHEDVWPLIVRPALTAKQGRALFVSTPHGRNWFYRLFQDAETAPGWGRIRITYADVAVLPPAEIASARKAMTDEEFAQEFLCKWDPVQVGAILGKEMAAAEAEGRVGEFPWQPGRGGGVRHRDQ